MADESKDHTSMNQHSHVGNNGIYEIKIKGYLDDHWKSWFEGMTLKQDSNSEPGQECTIITGLIVDQPALHGVLAKIRDLNLTLISVRKIGSDLD